MSNESDTDDGDSVYEGYIKSNLAGDWQQEQMQDDEQITIGYYDDPIRGPKEVAGFPKQSLLKHLVISGVTGYGGASVLSNIQLQLLEDGHGMCFLDSRGSDSESLLEKMPESRVDDIVYCNPASDGSSAVGFNIFETGTDRGDRRYEQEVMSIAEDFASVLRDVLDDWDSRMDTITKGIVTQLIRADDEYTVFDFARILSDDGEMDDFVARFGDELDQRFRTTAENLTAEKTSSVVRRLRKWINTDAARKLLADETAEMTVTEAVEDGKILILDMSAIGSTGIEEALTQAITSRIWSTIKSRGEIPKDERDPYYLCVDSYDSVATEAFNLNSQISLARSFKFSLILLFQQFSQLPEDAALGCRQTLLQIALNAGQKNTRELEYVSELYDVSADRFANLEPFEAVFHPVSADGFQSNMACDITLFSEQHPKRRAESVIESSIERYGTASFGRAEWSEYGV